MAQRLPYSSDCTVFETERILARGYSPSDVEAAFELYGDPEVMRFLMGTTPSVDLADQSVRLAAMIKRCEAFAPGNGSWAVVDKPSGRVVGTAIFRPSIPVGGGSTDEIEIGWHVVRRAWGMGYGTAIGRALIEYGFGLEIHRMIALIEKGNARSTSLARRIGMREAGLTRDYYDGQELCLWEMAR